jgi:NADPH:quinone reductase-like Zn-dependent oxidoreductase
LAGQPVIRVVARGGQVVLTDVAAPQLRAGEVLVQTRYSVISPGTERAIVAASASATGDHEYPSTDQTWPHVRAAGVEVPMTFPRAAARSFSSLGYGLAGTVLEVAPDVRDIVPGDKVACAGSQCAFHAERVAVPRNLTVPVPAGLPLAQAAFVTLGAIAMESLRRTRCSFGETVVIFGGGVLGVLAVQLAAAAGIYTACVDPDPARLALAAAYGALTAAPGAKPGLTEQLLDLTDGFGADAAVIAVTTDASDVIGTALGMVRRGALVVLVGQLDVKVDRDRLFESGATLVTSSAYGPGRYDPVYEESNIDFPIDIVRWTENRNMKHFLRLAGAGHVDIGSLPVVTVPVAEAPAAYRALARDSGLLTGVLDYGGTE